MKYNRGDKFMKDNLDLGGKIINWNEQEINKLIKEKEEFLKKKQGVGEDNELCANRRTMAKNEEIH